MNTYQKILKKLKEDFEVQESEILTVNKVRYFDGFYAEVRTEDGVYDIKLENL